MRQSKYGSVILLWHDALLSSKQYMEKTKTCTKHHAQLPLISVDWNKALSIPMVICTRLIFREIGRPLTMSVSTVTAE